MPKKPIQHYVAKLLIRRFMKKRTQLYMLDVDTGEINKGKLRNAFGKRTLWSRETEDSISRVETAVQQLMLRLDKENLSEAEQHRCTVWELTDPHEASLVVKMAFLQPLLLPDLAGGPSFEDQIVSVLDNDYSSYADPAFYIRLYPEHCVGQFLIMDFVGQPLPEMLPLDQLVLDPNAKRGIPIPVDGSIPHFIIAGEYELFFVGPPARLRAFLDHLRHPQITLRNEDGTERTLKPSEPAKFQLSIFNLNQISAQESECAVGSYDEAYLNEIGRTLPQVISPKIMWRQTTIRASSSTDA